jgi:hypothetical protein
MFIVATIGLAWQGLPSDRNTAGAAAPLRGPTELHHASSSTNSTRRVMPQVSS